MLARSLARFARFARFAPGFVSALLACDGTYPHPSPYPVPTGVSVRYEAEGIADADGLRFADADPASPPFLGAGAVPAGTHVIVRYLTGVEPDGLLPSGWPRAVSSSQVFQILPEDVVFASPASPLGFPPNGLSGRPQWSGTLFRASDFETPFAWRGWFQGTSAGVPSTSDKAPIAAGTVAAVVDRGGLWIIPSFDTSPPPEGDYVSTSVVCDTDAAVDSVVYLHLEGGAFALASPTGCADTGTYAMGASMTLTEGAASAVSTLREREGGLGFGIKGNGSLIGECPGNERAFFRDFLRVGCLADSDCPGGGRCVGNACGAPAPGTEAHPCLVTPSTTGGKS